MTKKLFALAGAALGAATLALSTATPASAAVSLVAGEESCNLFTTGCLFTWSGGGSFDDPVQIFDAYNAAHTPADLPELTLLGKAEDDQGDGDVTFQDNGNEWIFTDLPFDVSYYTVKTGGSLFLLFGLDPALSDFSAENLRIFNGNSRNPGDISHVAFFGADGGGGGGDGAVPEPGTWALMILGFGAAGSMLRRRRTVIA